MLPLYEKREDNFEVFKIRGKHNPPHLHKSIECLYVTRGTIELGIGLDFFYLEKGDFAIIFPEVIHHYQVLDKDGCEAIYLLASPTLSGKFMQKMQQFCPVNPVIRGNGKRFRS